MMKRVKTYIVVAAFLSSMCHGNANATPNYRSNCEPIGRNYISGKIVCKGDVANVSAPLRFLCFANQQWMDLTHFSLVGNVCDPPKITNGEPLKRCTQFNQGKPGCWLSKGTNSIYKPELISPYTSVLINGRPDFVWTKISNADSYLIQVKGKGISWSKEVRSAAFAYPKEQPSLLPGEAYQIITTAFSGSTPLVSDTTSLSMLASSETSQVQKQIQFVKEHGISPDEAAYLDLDSIYRHYDLYTATINTLKSRVNVGTQNPDLYRVLGNRYWQVGLPQLALRYYDQGALFAQQQNNHTAVEKIKTSINQLTTNSPLK